MKTLHMTTLGCDKNTIDSEMMLGLIEEKNYEIIDDPQAAEIIIVNTCCFIQSAKEQSIDYILEYVEYKNSGSCQLLIVAGCMAERYHQELAAEIPEVDGFLGVGHFDNIVELLTHLEATDDIDQQRKDNILAILIKPSLKPGVISGPARCRPLSASVRVAITAVPIA
jgi:ribosomal protein S12 methylthiotransferase